MSLKLFRAALLSYNDTPESITSELLETLGKMYQWFPQLADTIDTVLEKHKAHLLKEQAKVKSYDHMLNDMDKQSNIVFSYDPGHAEDVQEWYERFKNNLDKRPRPTVF